MSTLNFISTSIRYCFLLFVLSMIHTLRMQAQVPTTINYQAMARNSSGNSINNQLISFRFSIRDGSPTGSIVYQESQTVLSNNVGICNVVIGSGTVLSGSMTNINWSTGNKFIQVEMDPNGGSSYTNMGTQAFQSVPYAFSSRDNMWSLNGNHISNKNSGNVGIGTTTPGASLDVVGSFKLTNGTQGAGKVLTSDANGLTSWQSTSSLVGPQGPAGPQGATGPQGIAGAGYLATSSSSLTIGTGSKTLTTQSGLAYLPAERVRIANSASNYMEGTVTSYSGTSMIINIDRVVGSGTFSAWNIGVAGDVGASGTGNVSGTTNYISKFITSSSIGNSILFDNGTSIGVGTTSPNAAAKVDVNGSIWSNQSVRVNSDNDAVLLVGTNSSSTPTNILFSKQAVNAYWYCKMGLGNGKFFLNSLYDSMLTINVQGGYTGLNVTNPNARLDICQPYNFSDPAFRIRANSGTSSDFYSLGIKPYAVSASNVGYEFRTTNNGGTTNSSTMVLTGDGKTGLGLTDPKGRLDIYQPYNATEPALRIRSNTTAGFTDNYNMSIQPSVISSANVGYLFGTTNNGGVYTNYPLVLSGDGRVAMNTTTPANGYQLTVNGKVICTELRVQLAPFPDYVFESSYNLKPLSQVEAFIKEHKHLPGMPSAVEVESNAMNVGDIELKLVEKVEELTLHLIEQQKEIETLKALIKSTK
ncbi:MAG: collagen-like protein [Chitinophagaceae bacterium]|nr:collagen-like protein [Chitinophagaceae bacterium]